MTSKLTNKPKILIVDDDVITLTVIKRFLRTTGQFDIEIVEDASSGLALIESGRHFQVAISDMALVGANGIDFLRRVKELSPSTSCVIISGFLSNGAEKEILNHDFIFGVLTKPCTGQQLSDIITSALRQNGN
ncbi:MAG: response regulator [Deltaproteobacteria bacterium]|nr:response regulator [Deltaproteobacteria bacterium]